MTLVRESSYRALAMDEYEQRFMAPGERIIFREKIVAKGAFTVGLVLALGFALLGGGLAIAGAFVTQGAPLLVGGALNVGLAAFFAVTSAMFSVTRTMITDEHVHVHFGWAKRKIARASIVSVKAVKQLGFKQGKVSIGVDGVVRTVASTSSSRNAIEIETVEEGRRHVLTVGTDDPDGFLAALDAARVRVAPTTDAERSPVELEAAPIEAASLEAATRRAND